MSLALPHLNKNLENIAQNIIGKLIKTLEKFRTSLLTSQKISHLLNLVIYSIYYSCDANQIRHFYIFTQSYVLKQLDD